MCLDTILQVLHFHRLSEFSVTVGSRLGSVGHINDMSGSWRMRFVFVVRFYFFLTQVHADMMFRENSRPPGEPNHVCPRPPRVHLTYF